MSTSTIERVTTLAESLGFSGYTAQIRSLADLIDRGADRDEVRYALVRYGMSPRNAESAVETLFATAATSGEASGFDRATAAATIRAFIQNGERHVGNRGASKEDVDALLILAGLEDEPEPEPEVADEPGLLSRLASWARGQGFRG